MRGLFYSGIIIRLLSQIVACLIVTGSGVKIIDIGDYYILPEIDLGPFALLLSVFSIM